MELTLDVSAVLTPGLEDSPRVWGWLSGPDCPPSLTPPPVDILAGVGVRLSIAATAAAITSRRVRPHNGVARVVVSVAVVASTVGEGACFG